MQKTIVCPFCPLHCDNVIVDGQGWVSGGCGSACEDFQAAFTAAPARLRDQTVDAPQLSRFVSELQLSPVPIVEFGWLSIEQAKRLHDLQQRIVVKLQSGAAADAQTIARDGFDSATLADLKKHADGVLAIGDFEAIPQLLSTLKSDRATFVTRDTLSADAVASLRGGDTDSEFVKLRESRYLGVVVGNRPYEPGSEVACAESLYRFVRERNGQPIRDTET
ncbi:MAG: hypothetical protein AAFX06_23435, partial [Planctomycetota bacterium]